MECRKSENLAGCTCTAGCSNRGICCLCVSHHREKGQIPGCFFPSDAEKTYDRSIEYFIEVMSKKLK